MRKYKLENTEYYYAINPLDETLPKEVKEYLKDKTPYTKPANLSSVSYTLDDISELSKEEIDKNIKFAKSQNKMITINDVGNRKLSKEEIEYNKKLSEETRKQNLIKINKWKKETVVGQIFKILSDDIYNTQMKVSNLCKFKYREYNINIFNSDFGDFGIMISKIKNKKEYYQTIELGPGKNNETKWYYSNKEYIKNDQELLDFAILLKSYYFNNIANK